MLATQCWPCAVMAAEVIVCVSIKVGKRPLAGARSSSPPPPPRPLFCRSKSKVKAVSLPLSVAQSSPTGPLCRRGPDSGRRAHYQFICVRSNCKSGIISISIFDGARFRLLQHERHKKRELVSPFGASILPICIVCLLARTRQGPPCFEISELTVAWPLLSPGQGQVWLGRSGQWKESANCVQARIQ